jgi:putative sterol carrier protein
MPSKCLLAMLNTESNRPIEIPPLGVTYFDVTSAHGEEWSVSEQEEAVAGDGTIDASGVDPQEFARMVAEVPREQLREGLTGAMRRQVLDEIFRRMEGHYQAEKAGDLEALIRWRIGGRPDGGYDEYEVEIRDHTCRVGEPTAAEPRVSFQLDDPVDFLRLVTGNANGPMLFMTGKLKINGDLMFAPRVQSFFRIPS